MRNNTSQNKNLLILGGSRITMEIVKAAKRQGIYTIVSDWYPLEDSPAKQIADKYYTVDNKDIDTLLKIIENNNVNGILTGFTDSTLLDYARLCKAANLPCYGSEDLFELFTNKNQYKNKLREYGIPTIEEYEYTEKNIYSDKSIFNFPVLVKPSDGSGGKGVSVAYSENDLEKSYEKALKETQTDTVLIEDFIVGEEVTIFFMFDKGEVYLAGIGNRHIKKNQGDKVLALPVAYTFPSSITPNYVEKYLPKMKKMLQDVGIKDGMMFAQCMLDGDKPVIYDIGYRLTGSLEYHIFNELFDYNPMDMLIDFAFSGNMFNLIEDKSIITPFWENYGFNISYLVETEKRIEKIEGIKEAKNKNEVIDIIIAHPEGDMISADKKGSLAQIAVRLLGAEYSLGALKKSLNELYQLIEIKGKNNESIKLEGFDPSSLERRVIKNDK